MSLHGESEYKLSCAGWDQGVPTMSLGEKSVLTIPGYVSIFTLAECETLPPGCRDPQLSICQMSSERAHDIAVKGIGTHRLDTITD